MTVLKRYFWLMMPLMIVACTHGTVVVEPIEPTTVPTQTVDVQASQTRPTLTAIPSPTSRPTATPVPTAEPTRATDAVQIEVGDNYYEPEVITVTVGTMVEWVPIGAHHHTIVSLDARDGWPGDGGVEIIGSRPFRTTFHWPGTYRYYCDLHPGEMDGVVIVVDEDED